MPTRRKITYVINPTIAAAIIQANHESQPVLVLKAGSDRAESDCVT
jgi:hypothetical protein